MPPSDRQQSRPLRQGLLIAMGALARSITRWCRMYRDGLQLAAMSDPELQDIGISRSDVFAVMQGTYRRVPRGISSKVQVGTEVAVPAHLRRLRPMEKISVSSIR